MGDVFDRLAQQQGGAVKGDLLDQMAADGVGRTGDPWAAAAKQAGYATQSDPWAQAAQQAGYSPQGDIFDQLNPQQGDIFDRLNPQPVYQSAPIQDVNQIPRGTAPWQIPGNVYWNARDFGRGMGAMAGLAATRFNEALPFAHDVSGIGAQPFFRPLPYKLRPGDPNSPIMPSDFESLGRIGYGILDSYDKHYTQPLLGHGLQPDVGAVYNYAAQQPLDFATDVLPLFKFFKGPELVGKASQLAAATPVAQSAISRARQLGAAALATPAATPVRAAVATAKDFLEQLKSLQPFKDAIRQDVKAADDELRPLWNALSNQEKTVAIDVAEGTHPFVHTGNLSPAMQAYLAARKNVADRMGQRLTSMALNTPGDLTWNAFLPYIMHKHGFGRADLISETDKAALLQDAIHDMAQVGFTPQYAPWIKDGEVLKVRRQDAGTLRGTTPAEEVKPGFSRARTKARGPEHSTNDLEALLARYTQVARYHHAYNEILHGAIYLGQKLQAAGGTLPKWLEDKIANGEWIEYAPRKLYESLLLETKAMDSHMAAQAVAALPPKMFMPTAMAKAIETAMNGHPNFLIRKLTDGLEGLATISSIQRRYMLGTSPAFPETQSVQNIFMLGITQFRGVKDTFTTLLSYALAQDPAVRSLIPVSVSGDIAHNIAGDARYLQKLAEKMHADGFRTPKGVGDKVARGIENLIDANMARLQAQDTAVRIVAAVYYALRLSEAEPKLGGAIKGMLSSGDAISRIRNVYQDATATEQAGKMVLKTLGDFSTSAGDPAIMQALKGVVLFPKWVQHIFNFSMSLPMDHPYKTALLNKIYQTMPLFQDQRLPDWALKAGAVPVPGDISAQGDQRFIMKNTLNPFTTVPEMIELLGFISGQDPTADPAVFSQMPLPWTMLPLIAARENPASMREFTDPSLVQFRGKQYKPEDIAAGRMIEQHPIPNLAEYVLRNTFSSPTRAAERLLAATQGGEPSQFTTIIPGFINPAIRNKTLPGGMQAPMAGPNDAIDLLTQILTGTRKIGLDTNAAQMQHLRDQRSYPQAMRAAILQGKMR